MTEWGEAHPELFWTLFIIWIFLVLYALAYGAEWLERNWKRWF